MVLSAILVGILLARGFSRDMPVGFVAHEVLRGKGILANPTLSLAASLGGTFPFNVLVGIPLSHAMTTRAFALVGG